MNKSVDGFEFQTLLEGTVGQGLELVITVSGNSMSPLFIDRKTKVLLKPADTIKIGEVYLFINNASKMVLHRLVKMNKDQNLLYFRGDHNILVDEPVAIHQVKAKVEGYYQQESFIKMNSFRQTSYLLMHDVLFILRSILFKFISGFRRLFR